MKKQPSSFRLNVLRNYTADIRPLLPIQYHIHIAWRLIGFLDMWYRGLDWPWITFMDSCITVYSLCVGHYYIRLGHIGTQTIVSFTNRNVLHGKRIESIRMWLCDASTHNCGIWLRFQNLDGIQFITQHVKGKKSQFFGQYVCVVGTIVDKHIPNYQNTGAWKKMASISQTVF